MRFWEQEKFCFQIRDSEEVFCKENPKVKIREQIKNKWYGDVFSCFLTNAEIKSRIFVILLPMITNTKLLRKEMIMRKDKEQILFKDYNPKEEETKKPNLTNKNDIWFG